MSYDICKSCKGAERPPCETCHFNRQNIPVEKRSGGSVSPASFAGPCLREICYFSCVTCKNNGDCFYNPL